MVNQYAALTLWGWAAIIQLIANFGVLNNLNLLTWMIILPIGFFTVNLVNGVFLLIAYDKSWEALEAGTSSLFESVRQYVLEVLIMNAATTIELMMNSEDWFMANYMRLPAEAREEKKKGKKMDRDEKLAVLASLVSF